MAGLQSSMESLRGLGSLAVKGQLISKEILNFSFEPKTQGKYFCIPALASKSGQIKKI